MNDCSKVSIGERIKKLREAKGLSQEDLSKEIHITREVIAKWETGERDLKTEYTVKLADFFNVTCDKILRNVDSDNVDIHKKTGLGNEAIEQLIAYNDEWLKYEVGAVQPTLEAYTTATLNILLKTKEGQALIEKINLFMLMKTTEVFDLIEAALPGTIPRPRITIFTSAQELLETQILSDIQNTLKTLKEKNGGNFQFVRMTTEQLKASEEE